MSVLTIAALSHGLLVAPPPVYVADGAEDIKRRIELYVVGILRGVFSGWTIVPSKGGDDTAQAAGSGDAAEVEPPFILVQVQECAELLPDPPTHQALVKVAYFSRLTATTTPQHSAAVGAIGAALRALPRGYYLSTDLTINGIELQKPEEIRDDGQDLHGDVFSVALGVTEGPVG